MTLMILWQDYKSHNTYPCDQESRYLVR